MKQYRHVMCLCSFLGIALSCVDALAESCPSVEEVQHNQLGQWRVFDANSGHMLSPENLMRYESKVQTFALAAYYEGAFEGPAQCYYDGASEHYHLDAYLARHHLMPDFSQGHWHKDGGLAYVCEENLTHCVFKLGYLL